MKKLVNAIRKYGLTGTAARFPNFIRSRTKRFLLHPSFLTRFGVTRIRWERFQMNHELNFWRNLKSKQEISEADSSEKRERELKDRFNNIRTDFEDKIAVDVGCGPYGGFLPHVNAKIKIGVEPLAKEFQKLYPINPDIIMLSAMAENIPLLSGSVDACYCINMLDHTMKPYKVMGEIYRILKPGGYLAFAVDVGGAKKHPIKIFKKDLDAFFDSHPFELIEKSFSAEKSHWGKDSGIPVYTFQGYKF